MSDNTFSTYKDKGQKSVDILALLQECKSYWWMFLVSVVGCCALAVVYSGIKLPDYTVQANVLVASEEDSSSSMSRILSGSLFGTSNSVDDEQIIMSSHLVLLQTVKELGLNKSAVVKYSFFDRASLFNDEPVMVSYPPELNDTISKGLVFKIWVDENENVKIEGKAKKKFLSVKNQKLPVTLDTPFGPFTFSKTEYLEKGKSFKETVSIRSYLVAAELLAKNVNIYIPNKKANFITLELTEPNIDRAKATLNTIVENYNLKGVADKRVKGNKTADFLDQRLALLAQELDTSEKNMEAYKKNNKITDVRAEAAYLMSQKGSIEAKLLEAETENEVLKMTRDFMTNPSNKYSLIPLSGFGHSGQQSALTAYINSFNGLILNRMKIENNAKSNNASLKVINEQLDAMRANIDASLTKAIEQSNISVSELRHQASRSQSKLGEIPTQEREFYNIKRQQGVKEQLYLFLLQQREQAAISVANSVPKGNVVDEAYAYSKPVSMSRSRMVMVAFVLGLLFPIGYIFAKKKLRNKFSTRAEVEDYVNVPVLGEVCTTKRQEALVVKGSSSIAELFRLIRSRLQFIMTDSRDKVVLVTSTMSGEGKSFISINLAASFALLGKKVLLVGMDIRKPQLAKYLGVNVDPGLTQYLSSDNYKISDLIQHNTGLENLDVVVAGPVPPNPAELLASDKLGSFFNTLREQYDLIFIDSAPVGMVSDTFVLDRLADASVYVCRADYTNLRDLDFMNSIYKEKRLKKMSLIVNGTAARKGYGYGYGSIDA